MNPWDTTTWSDQDRWRWILWKTQWLPAWFARKKRGVSSRKEEEKNGHE